MTTSDLPNRDLRIGQLADATGLTVRTLRYYEEIGLLDAPARTAAGHRTYSAVDVERLYRVGVLRSFGLALGDIKDALDDAEWQLRSTLQAHLGQVTDQAERSARLRSRLSELTRALEQSEQAHMNELITIIEEMNAMSTVKQRISILVYADIEAAQSYLVRVFGLGAGDVTRIETGEVVHAAVEAGDGTVWLHPETSEFALASPQTVGAATATMAVMVDDIDAHHDHAVAQGAEIVYPPVDQPYGYREYSARDLEGGLWSFMKPLD